MMLNEIELYGFWNLLELFFMEKFSKASNTGDFFTEKFN
jgi:hypothetical protein